MEKVISVNEKKIVKWGVGYVVFITKEAKKFGWTDKHKVRVSAVENGKEKKIILEKI
ncbi:MAG: hypothetical protein KJ697_04010 [Nanoarchaeota archaeon]|nr:hypothetical protein [Nanoarchaeota archaeon]